MIMKTKIKILIGLIVIGICFGGVKVLGKMSEIAEVVYVAPEEVKPIVTHAQDVWISALEWCESKGVEEAINPKDRDGTKSFYSFQFKPGTFRSYGEKYGVIKKGLSEEKIRELMKSQELQRKIVENMINDKSVRWAQQFPDCVKNKIGYPPKY